jgi:prepilin-type N-terminal cleavage/methylation domain-containing protein
MIDLNKKDKYRKSCRGFSLIELMIVVTILSLMVLGLVTFFSGGARSWISGQNQLKAQREARVVMDSMVKEIREGKSVVAGSYENGVTITYPAALGKEQVKFELVNGQILRTVNEISNILIDNIPGGGLTFDYFDNEENPIADPTDASKLIINLQVDVDKDMHPDIVIETEVNLRNYGLTG